MAQGELLASAGTYVTPAHLNIFAMGGVMTVPVKRKPRVAIIPTGDELVPGVLQPGPGQTVESNSYSMAAKLKEWGAVPLLWPIQPDNPELIQATLRSAAKEADLIVAGGGSGRGLRDYMQDNLSAAGRLYHTPSSPNQRGRSSRQGIRNSICRDRERKLATATSPMA